MPPSMCWQAAVCLDPATVAIGGIRDGNVRVGDRVAVFGLGAIGLMAVEIAKIAGASFVVAVDPIAVRREVAAAVSPSADLVLDPSDVDVGLEIRRATGGAGVDVAIETSGNARALHHAIRGLAFGGTVALTAWYNEFRGGLDLGREAHFNRPTLVFTRAESEPHRDHPRWNNRRQADAAWDLLAAGRLGCEAIVQPVVPFERSPEAYREIDEHPERSVKLGVSFG
jgi:threonine dehydrogenase-like Zn-dependent dehydrogenase